MRAEDERLIIDHALIFFARWKGEGLKADDFWETRDETIRKILGVKGAEECLAREDVMMVLQDVVMYTQKSLAELSREELEKYIGDRLLKKQRFVTIFPLYGVEEFPSGMKIGPATALVFNELSEEAKEFLEGDWDYEFERAPGIHAGNRDQFIQERREATFLRVEVEACGLERALQLSTSLVEDSLAILRSFFDGIPLDGSLTYSEDGRFRGSQSGGHAFWPYRNIFAEEIRYWTDILTKSHPTDLEGRLRRAYRLNGLSTTVDRNEIKFILLAVGLESLLLGKADKDYLRQRFAEKAAFLTAKDKDGRLKVYEKVKDLYDKRSAFVHSGLGIITQDDVKEIEHLFWEVVRAIDKLTKQGYVKMEKDPGKQSVDEFVEGLRFQ